MSSVRRRSGYSSLSTSAMPSLRATRGSYGAVEARNARVSFNGLGAGFDLTQALSGDNNSVSVSTNDKETMQNLNDRLAAYLQKVRSLEAANARLELQIREWYEKRTPAVRDYSQFELIIEDLRKKILAATQANAGLLLQIDNAKLAGEDFRVKFENEQAARMAVEGDIMGLRKILDDLTMSRSDLEINVEGLKEELVYLKKNHEEELAALRSHATSSSVNVEVEAKPQEDLNRVLEEVRAQYEGIAEKNRQEMEAWYKVKFDNLKKEMESSTETLQVSRTEINDLKKTLQALQIELQSQQSMKYALEGTLSETEARYCDQLRQLQIKVDSLESELTQVKDDIERQSMEYQMLLDIKTRLEMEIAEYRRLLDGEDVTTTKVVEVKEEKRKPVITQRTKVVIEEIIDGKVVSRKEDVDTAVINKLSKE